MQKKEVYLGRKVNSDNQPHEENQQESKEDNIIKISSDPKVSRKAVRIYLNDKTE